MLKVMKLFTLVILLVPSFVISTALAGGSVDNGLNITVPCVNVSGSFYEVELLKFDHPSDPSGLYWQLGPAINATTDDGDCAKFDAASFGLTLTNLDVLGTLYDVTLVKYDCAQYPNDLFFSLAGATPVSGGGALTLSTTSFTAGSDIPSTYVCSSWGGSDISPDLSWSNAPSGTSSYALIMDDETSPCGTGDNACKHWSVYNIPASESGLAQGIDISNITGVTEGANYTGGIGYAGPCPPSSDMHTYTFTVYALSSGMPTVPSGTGMTRSMFESTYNAYILDSATITGIFATP